MSNSILSIAFLSSFFSATLFAGDQGAMKAQTEIARLVRETAETFRVPGLSVVVLQNGVEIARVNHGKANLETGTAVDETTVFQLASIAKPITAAAVMKLVEKGALRLDDPVSKYLSLPGAPEAKPITIEQLLTHTSGLKSFDDLGKKFDAVAFRQLRPAEALALLEGEPRLFEPGTGYAYSNSNYLVLAMVVEKLAGVSFASYVGSQLTAPAGFSSISVCDTRHILPGRAAGYRKLKEKIYNAPSLDLGAFIGSGALCARNTELAAWFEKLLAGKIVTPASVKRMRTAAPRRAGQVSDYGYGLSLGDLEGHRKIWHAGDTPGFSTLISAFPDDHLVISVLANLEFGPADLLSQQISRYLLKLAPLEVRDVPLSSEQAALYVGDYNFSRYPMRFSYVDGRLYSLPVDAPDEENWMPLLYQGDHVFMASGRNARIRFHVEGKAVATGMSFGSGSEWSKPFLRAPKK